MVFSLLTPLSATANVDVAKPFKPDNQNDSIMQLKAAIAEQEQNQLQQPLLHPDLQDRKGNEEVGIIVHLSEDSVGLAHGKQQLNNKSFTAAERSKVINNVKTQQAQVKKMMRVKNINAQEKFTYDTVLNGLALTVKADELQELLNIPGVTLIEPDLLMYALDNPAKDGQVDAAMSTSAPHLGIEKLWDKGIEGENIKVGVLDTGIDYNHPEFEGIYKGGRNYIQHTSQYARPRADNDPYETAPKDRAATTPEFDARGSSFYTSHGTHVAGTIAAIGNNAFGIKGLAPKVDLYAYRVLGGYGSGSTSGIIKAIEDSVKDGMDVINLSLGGSSNSAIAADAIAINNAMIEGTVAVIATGNSGPERGTIGNPSTAALGIAVGNSTNPEVEHAASVSVKAGAYDKTTDIKLMGVKFGEDLAAALAGDFEVVAIPNIGAAADYTGLDVQGKVALVSRGDIAFVDKISAAKTAGASAILIHNAANGAGAPGPSDVYLGDSFDFIPAFDMSYTEGQALRDALVGNEGQVSFSNFTSSTTTGDSMNPSSSRGPANPDFDIKPDVTAPGTNIMSAIPMYGKDSPDADYSEAYDRKSGTSMATPHIAAIAALVKQANPTWTPFDVKVALSNTATLIDTNDYDVFAQGAGRVQPYEAAFPTILAYSMDTTSFSGNEVDHEKGTVTFGKLPQVKDQAVTVTKQIRIVDAAKQGGNYSVRVETTKAFGAAQVTVDKPTFTLNGTEMLEVTLNAPQAAAKKGDELLGYIHISGGGTEVSLPFAADFNALLAETAIEDLAITATDLSFNGDGIQDTAALTFKLTGDVKTNYIELWDIMNPDGGEYGDGYIGYLHASDSLAASSYKLDIQGTYKPWAAGVPQTTIPDGLYTIDFTAQTVSGNPPIISDYVGPVVVKSQAGTIEGAVAGTTATGKIIDKYVDYQAELVNFGLGYDINTKLNATFEVLENSVVKSSGAVTLAQDGTFTFDVGTIKNTDTVKVKYSDAAGNKAEQILEKGATDTVTYAVNTDNLTLQIGGTEQLTVTETTTKPDGTTEVSDITAKATYQSANATIATVTNGKVTAMAAGETTITVSYKDFTQVITVKVAQAGQEIVTYAVNKTSLTLGIDQQEQLIVTETTTKPDGTVTVKDVTARANYNSTSNNIATVKNGLVTAKAIGTTQVRIQLPGQQPIVVDVEVKAKPQNIVTYAVNKTSLTLGVDQQEQLIVTETTTKPDGTVTEKDVTARGSYNVVNNSIANVRKGLVNAKKVGKTQVRINIPNEETIYVYLEVTTKAQDIITYHVDRTNMDLQVGQQQQLKVTEITTKPNGQVVNKDVTNTTKFNVTNNQIATVQKGLVTAKAAGITQVRVRIPDQEPILVYLVVTEVPQDTVTYSVNKETLTLTVGQQEQLIVTETTTKPNGQISTRDVTATGSYNIVNNSVATIKKGLITPLTPGSTQARIKIPNQETILVYITVVEEPKDIVTYSVNVTDLKLIVGQQGQIFVTQSTLKPSGEILTQDVTGTVSFNVVNNQYATVHRGIVTARAAGQTQVNVKIPDQATRFVYLVVTEEPKDVITYAIDTTNVALKVGEQQQLTVTETTTKPDGSIIENNVTADAKFKSSHPKVVTLNKGLVTAVGPGISVITVTHPNFTTTVYATVESAVQGDDLQPVEELQMSDDIAE